MSPTDWTRAGSLRQLDRTFDVLVVGGGVTGAGAALDLAARGLAVAVAERADFAQGTSSRSTKLFHGGIRYLPQMQFQLVSEGLREQKVLARIADFLYHPLEFVIPLYRQHGLADAPRWAARGWRAPLALRAGLTLYDVLGGWGRPGEHHRRATASEVLEMMPSLRPDGLTGGFVYSDAQTDDTRLVLSVLKTAVRRHGVVAVNRMRVDLVEPLDPGFRVRMTDLESDAPTTLTVRAVLAATGAFLPPGLTVDAPRLELVRSKGTHLILHPEQLGLDGRALVLPETDDGRVLYIIPWLGHSMVGTTDTAYTGDPAHPCPLDDDVDYLLRHLSRYLAVGDVRPVSAFAGLRALAAADNGSTAKASREHVIRRPYPGYVQVAGGKLTTYRRIAADAADMVASDLGLRAGSPTAELPLIGAGVDVTSVSARLRRAGIPDSALRSTVGRYGVEAEMIARLTEDDPELAEPLGDGQGIMADVVYAVRHEAASTIADFTLRRTHLAWFTEDHARSDAPRIAAAMGAELGWSDERRQVELARHQAELAGEGL
jgi:glycerol-3-phosphate dehydrogenase